MKPTQKTDSIFTSPPANTTTELRNLSGFSFLVVEYADQEEMTWHSHEYAHLVFSLNGTITQSCRKQTLLLNPCSLVFLPQGEPHAVRFQEGVRTLHIEVAPQWQERVQHVSACLDQPAHYKSGLPVWLAMRAYRELQQRDNLTSLMLEGLMLELVATMSRHLDDNGQSQRPVWLKQARDLLHDRCLESLSVDEIAAAVGVHPSHLMQSFRQHYHCTIGDYIRRLRVEYATHLLSASVLPVSQIAYASGFADQSHFCRTFKRFTGLTPTQFQKACQ